MLQPPGHGLVGGALRELCSALPQTKWGGKRRDKANTCPPRTSPEHPSCARPPPTAAQPPAGCTTAPTQLPAPGQRQLRAQGVGRGPNARTAGTCPAARAALSHGFGEPGAPQTRCRQETEPKNPAEGCGIAQGWEERRKTAKGAGAAAAAWSQQGQGPGSGWIASAQSTPGSRICHGLTASPGEGIDVPVAPGRSLCKPRRNPDLDGPRLTPGQVLRVAAAGSRGFDAPPALHMHADSDAPRLPQAWTKRLALKIILDPLGKGGGMEFKGITCNRRHLLKKNPTELLLC